MKRTTADVEDHRIATAPDLTAAAAAAAAVVVVIVIATVPVVVERRHVRFDGLHQECHLRRDGGEPAEILRI